MEYQSHCLSGKPRTIGSRALPSPAVQNSSYPPSHILDLLLLNHLLAQRSTQSISYTIKELRRGRNSLSTKNFPQEYVSQCSSFCCDRPFRPSLRTQLQEESQPVARTPTHEAVTMSIDSERQIVFTLGTIPVRYTSTVREGASAAFGNASWRATSCGRLSCQRSSWC